MPHSSSPCRLLFMMKAPEPGLVKTRLAGEIGVQRATALYRRFVEWLTAQILTAPARSWESVVVFDPPNARQLVETWFASMAASDLKFEPQVSGDLGERLSAAFEQAFDAGAAAVLAIGTDCLDLTPEEIQGCFDDLKHHDVVLGEARDGGYWCIGMSGRHVELFREMPWSQPGLAAATRSRAKSMGLRIAERSIRLDIDHGADLDQLSDELKQALSLNPNPAGSSNP